MALILKIQKDSISADGLTMSLSDVTGNYDATLRPNGWGSPNDARNAVALILTVANKRYNGADTITDVPLVLVPNNADPLLVSSWTATLNKDGWQYAVIYGLHLYNVNTSFQLTELTYDTGSSQIRRIDSKSGSGPYTYTYTVMTSADLANVNYIKPYFTIYNTYTIPSLCVCRYKINKQYLKTLNDTSQDSTAPEDQKRWRDNSAYLESIKYDFANGSYTDGQKTVELVESACLCFTTECNC